jgi:hypothetical protein
MYMHITPKHGSSSTKKKDLAFKASQEKRGKDKVAHDSSSDDEVDDESLALMVRKTTKMLKKLNKNGIKFDGKKKKFFTSRKRKPIFEMDCYNCGDLGHLTHQCPKPKKDKYKKYRDNKDDSSDDDEKKKISHTRRRMSRRRNTTRRRMARPTLLVIGSWTLSHQGSFGDESDNEKEKVAALVIGTSLPPPSSLPSSSTHLCLMAKGDRKLQSDDDSSGDDNGSDSDEEFESPYDDLIKLLNQYTKIIRKTRTKNEKLQLENDSLLAKYDIAKKASDELREENKIVSSKLKELKTSKKRA